MVKIISIASGDGWWLQENTQYVRIAAWGLVDDGRVVPLTVGNDAELHAVRRLGDVRVLHQEEIAE